MVLWAKPKTEVYMDEKTAAEMEETEDIQEVSANSEEELEAQEEQQEVEEHDWGEVEKLREEVTTLRADIDELREAFATLSVDNEEPEAAEDVAEEFSEDGAALDLDELEQMLGL